MAPQPEKQPKTFDQLMGQLSKVKQYPIDIQPINPMPPGPTAGDQNISDVDELGVTDEEYTQARNLRRRFRPGI